AVDKHVAGRPQGAVKERDFKARHSDLPRTDRRLVMGGPLLAKPADLVEANRQRLHALGSLAVANPLAARLPGFPPISRSSCAPLPPPCLELDANASDVSCHVTEPE